MFLVPRRTDRRTTLSKKTKTALTRRRLAKAPASLPGFTPHPFRIYRTDRLAELFDVDRATIYRWRQSGVLPPFVEFGGIKGLTERQLAEVMQQRGAADAAR